MVSQGLGCAALRCLSVCICLVLAATQTTHPAPAAAFPPDPAVAVNDRQLRWAVSLAALMQAASAADKAAAAAAAAAAVVGDEQGEEAVNTPRATAALTPQTPLLEAAGGPAAASLAVAAGAAGAAGAAASPLPVPAAARPQTKALGVFGKVWDFMIDEAAYVEAAEGERALLPVRCTGWVGGWMGG